MPSFDERAHAAIPSTFRMISGCHDAQTSADVSNVGQFSLPDPAGKAGGACTSALLRVMYRDHQTPEQMGERPLSWVDVLRRMRTQLGEMGYDQVPQLTSSEMIEVTDPMHIVPPGSSGTRRAVLVGINYCGQNGELSGCHNDVLNIKDYLVNALGFEERNITVLMDDGRHENPTRYNITTAYKTIVSQSVSGDVVFCHYSGHGGQVRDENGDEDDGYDETLIPVDFQQTGQITDDELFRTLVHPMAEGVTATCLMDCCHSGTVLDLPYRFTADGDNIKMQRNEGALGGLDGFLTALEAGTGIAAVAQMAMGGGGSDSSSDDEKEDDDGGCCCLLDLILAFL